MAALWGVLMRAAQQIVYSVTLAATTWFSCLAARLKGWEWGRKLETREPVLLLQWTKAPKVKKKGILSFGF
jgi:hypothetical protein